MNSNLIATWLASLVVIGTTIPAQAGDADPAALTSPMEMSARIDELLLQKWQAENITPAPLATDAEFFRRIHLDLTGGLPSVFEVRAFLNNTDPNRRVNVIDSLLGTNDPTDGFTGKPDHWTHLANTWRQFLLPDDTDLRRYGGGLLFENWLREQFRVNKPYDEMVSELILAQGNVNQSGPTLFYAVLESKPEEVAAATSRALLGVQIQCAQCHDHPFDHWTQKDFWGYAAFFARLNRLQGARGMVQETDVGEVFLPESSEVIEPRFLKGDVAPDSDFEGVTRRQLLAEWLTSRENRYFAQATVNRVWAVLFGRGIVDPVDDLGQHNPASHPELLAELSEYFVNTDFDLRELIRTIANSQAYQLSSVSQVADDVPPDSFARMALKSMTAEQLYDSLADATIRQPNDGTTNHAIAVNRVFDANRYAFLNKFQAPAGSVVDYQSGIPQALTLMNGSLVRDATNLTNSHILGALMTSLFTDEQRVDILFLATLSRYPNDVERDRFVRHITPNSLTDEKRKAMSDILWALLNSAEFTLNH